MNQQGYENFTPQQLRNFIARQVEKDYLLVDVRQPQEYVQGHIPGAKLIPLMDLEKNVAALPADRSIVFYCRSGARSQAASLMAGAHPAPLKNIYNLAGGMMAWDGHTLDDLPRVEVFQESNDPAELMLKSMDLEKAALRFYSYIAEKHADQPFNRTIHHLVSAEKAHAKSIYRIWEKIADSPPAFDALFESMQGEVLEGGETLETALKRVDSVDNSFCLNLLEMALTIECQAYDLYRTMANRVDDEDAQHVFLSIAQVEKRHMATLATAISQCPNI